MLPVVAAAELADAEPHQLTLPGRHPHALPDLYGLARVRRAHDAALHLLQQSL